MSIKYTCRAATNPPGPGVLITVGVSVNGGAEMTFEVPVTKAMAANPGSPAIDPVPFAVRVVRAILLGQLTPTTAVGVSETE